MEEGSSSSTIIDIQNLQKFLKNNPDHCWASSNPENDQKILIDKIPHRLFQTHKDAFDPNVVSIGPYHHGKHSLRSMEKLKWKFLDHVLESNPTRNLDDYLKGLREVYPLAKNCYSGEIEITSNKFLQMLLLDGCFVLLTLCKLDFIFNDCNLLLLDENITPLTDPWQCYYVKNDLILVENQIPFAVIKRVYELVTGQETASAFLTDQIINFVERSQSVKNSRKIGKISQLAAPLPYVLETY